MILEVTITLKDSEGKRLRRASLSDDIHRTYAATQQVAAMCKKVAQTFWNMAQGDILSEGKEIKNVSRNGEK